MEKYKFWLKPENFKVVAFYPYTSGTERKILTQSHNYKTEESDFLDTFGNAIKEMVLEKGCYWDNKVVVELEFISKHTKPVKTSNIFVGYYDNIWSIGLDVWQDEWLEIYGSNKYFK